MKKRFKRIAAVLMCAWNLYMPNSMQEEQSLETTVSTPVVEEYVVEYYDDEVVDESKQRVTKRQAFVKKVVSFIPSLICGLFTIFGGWLKYPAMMILAFLLLVLVGWLLLKNKPWANILGILIGSSMIYLDVQDDNRIIEESMLGIFLIVYFLIIVYLTFKFRKKKIVIENV